jgi:hypothetical protein
MPSGLRKTTGNHFEIYYEQPWGGVASDKDPVDIAENQLVTQQGVVDLNGKLYPFILQPSFAWTSTVANSYPVLLWVQNQVIFAIDQFGFIYYLEGVAFVNDPIAAPPFPGTPWASPPSAVQVINGTAYISNYGLNSIFSFDGVSALLLASNYAGGRILGVLDDYLLQLNTNNVVDGIQPNRINWSGPGEFSTWDPSIDRSAGFNTLAGVEDQITGFLSFASVGIAITQKGLVELSPTGVAIGPFDFTTLWTSAIGQGCVYPDSVSQYGQIGYMATNSGVYGISTAAGFSDLSGAARTAILQTLNAAANGTVGFNLFICGSVFLYYFNATSPHPTYLLASILPQPPRLGVSAVLSIWALDIPKNTWSNTQYNVDAISNAYLHSDYIGLRVVSLNLTSLDQAPVLLQTPTLPNVTAFPVPITLLTMGVYDPGSATTHAVILVPTTSNGIETDFALLPATILQFRSEEIKLGHTRKPTIRRCVVKAYGSGTLACAITDVNGTITPLGNITLDGTANPRTYYSPAGIVTAEAPQLSITSTSFNGVIVKAMLAGTYADGEID